MLNALLKRIDPALYTTHRSPTDATMRLRYLGTAGFVVSSPDRTIVIDPYVSRPSLKTTLMSPLVPDAARIRSVLPEAHEVLVGHAHHDHVLDAPELCAQTGARLIGSRSVCNVGRAAGLPESQLVETMGRTDIECGDITVRGLPSRHGRVYFNRVSLPGDIPKPPPWPARFFQLRHGLVLNWHLRCAGTAMVHIDSADFVESELEGMRADVVCLCAIGRRYCPGYVERVVSILKPRFIIPCHWDSFFTPIESEARLLPGVDLPGFVAEIARAGVEPIVLPFHGTFGLKAADASTQVRVLDT